MRYRAALSAGLVLFVFSGCGEDAPTKPEPRAIAASPTTHLTIAPEELAGLAVALEDARSRILPTLGPDSATAALGIALGELERVLSQPEAAALEAALGRARAAAARLGAEPSLLPEVDVVLLVFDRIEALARGPAEPVVNAGDPRREP